MSNKILDIIKSGDNEAILALFRFSLKEDDAIILYRFSLWARYLFPQYFKSPDASFHKDIDRHNLSVYRGIIDSFTDIVFRGGAKTTRTKLFMAFVILNDKDHTRKYLKILTKDITNSKQSVTDIYNMFVNERVRKFYPNTFMKSDTKREESMGAFTTSFGVKVLSGTVGTDQRGALQEDARPDWIWFDDFETKKTLRSAVETNAIWENMQEAKTSLSGTGSCVYTCNYFSERGNVHKLVMKENPRNIVLIVPIVKDGVPTWFHTKEKIDQLMLDVDDFVGEFLCQPSAGKDILFDREIMDEMKKQTPKRTVAGFKMYKAYDASHRYASGADVAGGVGLDSSTNVIIDFETTPAQVVATYHNNEIKPDSFGDELYRQNEYYDYCYCAPEKNNHGHATIGRLKQIYPIRKLHETQKKDTTTSHRTEMETKEYGWHTNGFTKPKMIMGLAKAVNDGHLILNDKDLILECRSYTRNDLMDGEVDPRLTTRHFDLLTACAIAWQMKDFAGFSKSKIETNSRIQEIMDSQDFDPFSVV